MVIKQIIYMVLSLIVLVTIIGVPLYDYANTNIFGGKGVKSWIKGENKTFTPYKGELDINEKKVRDSLSALVCATNVVASTKDGKFVYDEKNCPGAVASNELGKCQGVLYGENCVVCERRDTQVDCQVKDFELPQKIDTIAETSSIGYLGYLSPLNWISAYGDPEYVVYYEAFPLGEEEAWQLDAAEVSLGMIAVFDIAIPVGGFALKSGGTVIKRGADLLADSKLAKSAKFMSKTTVVYYLYAGGKAVVKSVTARAAKLGALLKSGVEYGEDAAKRVVIKTIKPEVYIKIFADGDSILKYAKQDYLKIIFNNPGELEEMAMRIGKDKEFAKAAELILADYLPVATKNTFKDRLKDLPANIKPFVEKSALNMLILPAAIALAKEDSMDDKFAPIGINAIGFKKPYNEALITGQDLPSLNENVNQHYLALNKDGDLQQRFFLASPCKTNLKITTQKCMCGKTENVESINVAGKEFFAHNISFGENKYDFAVKECTKPVWVPPKSPTSTDILASTYARQLPNFESSIKEINCISIEPQDIEGFCYSGSHWIASGASWVFYGTSFFTGVGATALKATLIGGGTVVAGPFGTLAGWVSSLGVGVLQTGVDYGLALLEHWATSYTKWPNH